MLFDAFPLRLLLVVCACGLYRRAAVLLQVTTVVFDKTGTLTSGKPHITAVVSLDQEWDQEEVSRVEGVYSALHVCRVFPFCWCAPLLTPTPPPLRL